MSVLRKLEQGQELKPSWPHTIGTRILASAVNLTKMASCKRYRAAWTLEHDLISQWQPKLNHPFVQVFLKRTALGFRPARQKRFASFSRFGLRLRRKLHKRLFHSVQPLECAVQRRQA